MLRLGILATALMALSSCSDGVTLFGDCSNSVISRATAPDGLHSAVMFNRDCGATTAFSTQISVLKAEEEPSGGGNAFRADADQGAAVAGNWGGPWAEMKWIDNNSLLIRYASKSRIYAQNQEVGGVRIRYQQREQ